MSKLFLIRHGESVGNVNPNEYHTTHDSEILLTPNGYEQAQNCADVLLNLIDPSKDVKLFTSPYIRAVCTSEPIYEKFTADRRHVEVYENPLLREREWGNLRDLISSREFDAKTHFNFYHRPQNGESFADAYARVVTFFNMLNNTLMCLDCDTDIIVVSHGEWINLALMYIDGISVQTFVEVRDIPKNCCVITREY
jgi:2,3-bisphosphoglycerate-dependent phosphoglycerate mutase